MVSRQTQETAMARKWDDGYEGFSGFKDEDEEIVPDNPESMDTEDLAPVPRIRTSVREIIDWHYARSRCWDSTERQEYMRRIRESYSSYPSQEDWDKWAAEAAKTRLTRVPHTSTWFDD